MASLNDTEFYTGMASITETGRKTAKTVLKNFSSIVAIFAMVVLITLIFADVAVAPAFTWQWATKLVLYLVIMYVLFFSMQTTGLQDGRAQPVYNTVMKKYEELREGVRTDHELETLQEWCDLYIEQELRAARTKLLRHASMTYKMFEEKYIDPEVPLPKCLSLKKRMAIRKARRLRPVVLTPDMLLNCGSLVVGRSPLGPNPGTWRALRSARALIPRTVMLFLVTDMAISVIADPSWETVVMGIMMCFVGLLCAYQGYDSGFKNIVEDTVNYVQRQINLLSQYKLWLKKTPEQPEQPAEESGEGI
jgi:hypothetical protein